LDELKAERKKYADELGTPPYTIFSDKHLESILSKSPESIECLISIQGIPTLRANQHGPRFIKLIQEHKAARSETKQLYGGLCKATSAKKQAASTLKVPKIVQLSAKRKVENVAAPAVGVKPPAKQQRSRKETSEAEKSILPDNLSTFSSTRARVTEEEKRTVKWLLSVASNPGIPDADAARFPPKLAASLMDFQREGVRFALANNGRALIGDEPETTIIESPQPKPNPNPEPKPNPNAYPPIGDDMGLGKTIQVIV